MIGAGWALPSMLVRQMSAGGIWWAILTPADFRVNSQTGVHRPRGHHITLPTAASGVQMKAEFIMRVVAFLTQGKYLFLTDHSGVGNLHAKPHVPDYQVEHLNRLMIRMIASELSGRRLASKEVVAIEQGALPVSSGPWRPKQQGQQDSAVVPQQENHATVSRNSEAGLCSSVSRWMLVAVIGASLFVLDVISGRHARGKGPGDSVLGGGISRLGDCLAGQRSAGPDGYKRQDCESNVASSHGLPPPWANGNTVESSVISSRIKWHRRLAGGI